MVITQRILDELSAKAKTSERLRANLDLRNSAEDNSQRILNALDSEGRLTDTIDMVPGGVVLNIEKGQWHSLKCLESGTVLFEAKDGPYHPLDEDEIYQEL